MQLRNGWGKGAGSWEQGAGSAEALFFSVLAAPCSLPNISVLIASWL